MHARSSSPRSQHARLLIISEGFERQEEQAGSISPHDPAGVRIHLRELYDAVDPFFILESTEAQLKHVRKPLIWDRIKEEDRFGPFHDKIAHIR